MELFLKDLRGALKGLAKSPLFLAAVLLTLGLGIGLNSTVFSLADSVLFRPLPVSDPKSLVAVFSLPEGSDQLSTHSYPDYLDFKEGSRDLFSGLLGFSMMFTNLQLEDRSEILLGELVTGNYWQVLGLPAFMGRTFEPKDEDSPTVVMIGHRFWRDRLNGTPDAIGRSLRLNGKAYTVVGIAPENFSGLIPGIGADVYLPATAVTEVEPMGQIDTAGPSLDIARTDRRGYRWMYLRGRLAENVSIERAEAGLGSLAARLSQSFPETNKDRRVTLVPAGQVRAHPEIDRVLRLAAGAVFGLVAAILLVACANVANLVLSRTSSRRRELAIRQAVGADRKRLMGQLLVESLVIATLAALTAVVFSYWALSWIRHYQPPFAISLDLDLALDQRAVLFTFTASLMTALIFGLFPALKASKLELVPMLKEGPAGGPPERRKGRFSLRDGFVTLQIALSTAFVLVGALLFRSLDAAEQRDLGLDPDPVAAVSLHLGSLDLEDRDITTIYDRLLAAAEAVPGADRVALADRLPFSVNFHVKKVYREGSGAEDTGLVVDSSSVTPGFFETLGIQLLQGRDFEQDDRLRRPPVAVINSTLSEQLGVAGRPLGSTFLLGSATGPRVTVVGVVADHKIRNVAEDPRPMLYLAQFQQPSTATHMVARAGRGKGESLAEPLLKAALEAHPESMPLQTTTLLSMVDLTLYPVRAGAALCALFGALAIFLAVLGLYAVVAFNVSRRRKEVGIRIALGADLPQTLYGTLREGLSLTAVGITLGIAAGMGVGRLLDSVLYGVRPWDPYALFFAILLMPALALLAHIGPALAVTRISPEQVLREQ